MVKNYFIKPVFIIAIGIAMYSCSPQSNYKVLSVFFDGVPNPYISDSIQQAQSIADTTVDQSVRPAESAYTYHPPYREKDCNLCHDEKLMGRLTLSMPGLCYQCHENFKDRYRVLHGPVEAGYCTDCHNPHQAKDKNLLVRQGRSLCLYCHDENDVMANDVHEDTEDMNCTECHNPHGGDDRTIIN